MSLLRVLTVLGLLLTAALPAMGAEFNVIYQFTGKADGAFPQSLVAGPGGSLYGVVGTARIFKLDPPAAGGTHWTQSVIYLLPTYDPVSGAYLTLSNQLLVDAAGNVYATSSAFQNVIPSTIFELSPPGAGQTAWTKTVLCNDFNFKGVGSGTNPSLFYRDHDGVLFGTFDIREGGVFRLAPYTNDPGKWKLSLLTYFDQFHGNPRDGTYPDDLISTRTGAFYGVTNDTATVFRLIPPSSGQTQWSHQTIFDFNLNKFGEMPSPIIADRSDTLFGSSAIGGGGNTSMVYKLTPPATAGAAWTSTILHVFSGGLTAGGSLVEDQNGVLYGTSQVITYPTAALFKLTPTGVPGAPWNFATLHEFGGDGDGTGLLGLIQTTLPDGRFAIFGAAATGGLRKTNCVGGNDTGCGTIFEYIP